MKRKDISAIINCLKEAGREDLTSSMKVNAGFIDDKTASGFSDIMKRFLLGKIASNKDLLHEMKSILGVKEAQVVRMKLAPINMGLEHIYRGGFTLRTEM